jgi:hypothetical protein
MTDSSEKVIQTLIGKRAKVIYSDTHFQIVYYGHIAHIAEHLVYLKNAFRNSTDQARDMIINTRHNDFARLEIIEPSAKT